MTYSCFLYKLWLGMEHCTKMYAMQPVGSIASVQSLCLWAPNPSLEHCGLYPQGHIIAQYTPSHFLDPPPATNLYRATSSCPWLCKLASCAEELTWVSVFSSDREGEN